MTEQHSEQENVNENKDGRQEKREVVRHLPCVLTIDELAEQGQGLAALYAEAADLEASKKAAMSEYRAKQDALERKAKSVVEILHDRTVWRTVECEEILDYAERRCSVFRLDTGEQVEERTLTDAECQAEIQEGEDTEE